MNGVLVLKFTKDNTNDDDDNTKDRFLHIYESEFKRHFYPEQIDFISDNLEGLGINMNKTQKENIENPIKLHKTKESNEKLKHKEYSGTRMQFKDDKTQTHKHITSYKQKVNAIQ